MMKTKKITKTKVVGLISFIVLLLCIISISVYGGSREDSKNKCR